MVSVWVLIIHVYRNLWGYWIKLLLAWMDQVHVCLTWDFLWNWTHGLDFMVLLVRWLSFSVFGLCFLLLIFIWDEFFTLGSHIFSIGSGCDCCYPNGLWVLFSWFKWYTNFLQCSVPHAIRIMELRWTDLIQVPAGKTWKTFSEIILARLDSQKLSTLETDVVMLGVL